MNPIIHFDLSHLSGPPDEAVLGPIQDSEALLLYALIRVCQLRRVLELGAGQGYSARNFLAAVGPAGAVYSVDFQSCTCWGPNHRLLTKDIREVTPQDLDAAPLDLVFCDCHEYGAQLELLEKLDREGLLENAFLALHDTGLHPEKLLHTSTPTTGGWVHQPAERGMVNVLQERGFQAICCHCDNPQKPLKYRHGLTLLRRFTRLPI